ncbi:hypothetical protein BB559_002046 [Furculomyces boomerangus]|uniref:Importin N-terminal domain-containing protein n=1 Tax=Furculomyces boomerangus TaxID=61424 RepID=A0A2T9YYN6_9FUNG|nr:hypothetical protein BB559_002046 [Furculomyces boomerangus]
MNSAELASIFGSTFHPDQLVRSQMEQRLLALEKQPGFLSAVLNLITDQTADQSAKLAAAIYFKNTIRRSWKSSSVTSPNSELINDSDQLYIKQQILTSMINVPSNIQTQLQSCIGNMLAGSFPSEWPEFGLLIYQLLSSNDINTANVGLLGLLELTQIYRFKSIKNRKPVHEAVGTLFPLSLKIVESVIDSTNPSHQLMVKTAFKAFHASLHVDLPTPLTSPAFLAGWGSVFLKVISINANPSDTSPDDIDELEELEKLPIFKAKKWAFKSLNKLFSRYGTVSASGNTLKKYKEFAKMFTEKFSPKILETYLQLVSQSASGEMPLTPKIKYHILNFLADCVKDKIMWKILKPHSVNVITMFIFPELCYTQSDIDLWDSSPIEYANKKIDTLDDFNSPTMAATNLLIDLVSQRGKTTLIPTLEFINQQLEKYKQSPPESRSDQSIDGVFSMMNCLVTPIRSKKSPISGSLDKFLIEYVLPQLSSENKFLRAKALDTYAHYSNVELNNPQLLSDLFKKVVSLLADPELPVRIYAAFAIRPITEYESIQDDVVSQLPVIVEQLLILTGLIDLDLITEVIEFLAETYATQLEPYAIQLSQQLCNSLGRIIGEFINNVASNDKENGYKGFGDFEENSSKSMAAMGILRTLGTLVINLENSPQVVAGIEQTVYPMIKFILENRVVELYEECFEVIDCCTFTLKTITPPAYDLFNSIYGAFMDSGIDFIEDMLPSLDNYISFGVVQFCTILDLKSKMFSIIENIFTSDRVGETGRICGCKLIESVILYTNNHNITNPNSQISIDDMVVRFISLVSKYLSDPEENIRTSPFLVYLLQSVLVCMQYNADLTISSLNELNVLLPVLEMIATKHSLFTRVHDKRIYVLGVDSLLYTLATSPNKNTDLYQKISVGAPVLFKSTLKCIQGFSAAVKSQNFQAAFYIKKNDSRSELLMSVKDSTLEFPGDDPNSENEQVDQEASFSYERMSNLPYILVIVVEPNNPQTPLEIPNSFSLDLSASEKTFESINNFISELVVGGDRIEIGDFVHVVNEEDYGGNLVGHIFRIWKNKKTRQKGVFLCWYLHPWQTMHKITQMFFKNEVFMLPGLQTVGIDKLIDKCYVMDSRSYALGYPKDFDLSKKSPEDYIYICDSKYSEKYKQFSTIKKISAIWPDSIPDEKIKEKMSIIEHPDGPKTLSKVPSVFAEKSSLRSQKGNRKRTHSRKSSYLDQEKTKSNTNGDSSTEANDNSSIFASENNQPSLNGTNRTFIQETSEAIIKHNTDEPDEPNGLGVMSGNEEKAFDSNEMTIDPEIVRLFPTDSQGRIKWFATPPVNTPTVCKPTHSLAYLEWKQKKEEAKN